MSPSVSQHYVDYVLSLGLGFFFCRWIVQARDAERYYEEEVAVLVMIIFSVVLLSQSTPT